MSKSHPPKKKPLTDEELRRLLFGHTGSILQARLDLLTLQTALVDKGVISDVDLARAVEKVGREGKQHLDDLGANPEKLKAMLRGKRGDVP